MTEPADGGEQKNLGGRPPLYATPEELQKKIDQYFLECPDKIKKWDAAGTATEIPVITISGLVLYLGFCDRASFYDYEKREGFSHTIKRARTFIELEYEKALRSTTPTGAIFALKNFGWVDKSEVENTHAFKQMPTIKKNGKAVKYEVGG